MRFPALILAALCPLTLAAEPVPCPDPRFAVDGPEAELVCTLAPKVADQLASCSLPLGIDLVFEVREEISIDSCLALYHCGEGRIELHRPDAYAGFLEPDSAFLGLSVDGLFESILRHEMTHAALEDINCPFPDCPAAQEYLAYGMQVMFMAPEDRAVFEAGIDFDVPVRRDELNALILIFAPHVFARKAWTHLSQREDRCGFVAGVVDGAYLFDHLLQ